MAEPGVNFPVVLTVGKVRLCHPVVTAQKMMLAHEHTMTMKRLTRIYSMIVMKKFKQTLLLFMANKRASLSKLPPPLSVAPLLKAH